MEFNLAPELGDRSHKWSEETTRVIAVAALTELRSRKKDKICYMYYNGLKKDEEFKYLNEVGDYVYPAKVRFFQVVRPKIDLQLSKLTRRKINFATIASDQRSQKEKLDRKLQYYLNFFDKKLASTKSVMLSQIEEINQKLQEMEEFLANPPQNEEEAKMQDELRMMKPELEAMLIEVRTEKENVVLLTEDDEEKINHYWKYKDKDVRELSAQRYLKKAMQERDIQRKSIKAFKDQVITGKPLYYVDCAPGEKYPHFDQISPLYTCWSASSPTGYIQDGGWVSYTVPTGISDILSKFGDDLTETDKERLKDYQHFSRESNIKTNFAHAAYFTNEEDVTHHAGSTIDKQVDTTYVFWRSPRKVFKKSSPNPHTPGTFFTHIVSEEEILKTTLKEEETVQIRYIDDIYGGIMIGSGRDSIVIGAGPRPNQVYDVDTFKTQLPIVGYTFGDINDEPYSLVWATKDLQDLYNILMYQAELLTVLSGVKGFVMDKAQKPDEMSYAEWMYNRKLGVAWIDSMKKKFGRMPSFNQFQQYDDTLSQSIMYLTELAKSIDDMAGQIIGVPRQAVGETVSTDQVGTNKMSIDQSALVSEIQYYNHFDVLGKALTRFMNCARDQGVIEDAVTSVANDLSTDTGPVRKDLFEGRSYDIIATNTSNELTFMEDLKQIAINERAGNHIGLHDLIKVYQGNTLKEIEVTLEFAGKQAIEQDQQAQANAENAEADREMRLKQMDLQYKELNDKMVNQIKQLELQIKEKEQEMKMRETETNLAMKGKQQQFDQSAKIAEIQMKATDQQSKSVNDQFANKLAAINQKVDLLLGNRKLDIEEKKIGVEDKKVTVESKKVDKMSTNSNTN